MNLLDQYKAQATRISICPPPRGVVIVYSNIPPNPRGSQKDDNYTGGYKYLY